MQEITANTEWVAGLGSQITVVMKGFLTGMEGGGGYLHCPLEGMIIARDVCHDLTFVRLLVIQQVQEQEQCTRGNLGVGVGELEVNQEQENYRYNNSRWKRTRGILGVGVGVVNQRYTRSRSRRTRGILGVGLGVVNYRYTMSKSMRTRGILGVGVGILEVCQQQEQITRGITSRQENKKTIEENITDANRDQEFGNGEN